MRFSPPKPAPEKFLKILYVTWNRGDWGSKATPITVSNLHLLTLRFAKSNQLQTLFSSNSWRFECLLSDKNSRLRLYFTAASFGNFGSALSRISFAAWIESARRVAYASENNIGTSICHLEFPPGFTLYNTMLTLCEGKCSSLKVHTATSS